MTQHPSLNIRHFRVQELKWETENIFTLVLTPEKAEDAISFKPGQWTYLYLLNPDGSTWARAPFSIASAPEESAERVEFGIKVHGDFTKRAAQLIPDDLIGVQGPFGVFTLRENVSSLVMFAGGIGIAPLRSMIRSLAHRRMSTEVILFYSNKLVEETAYFEELVDLAKQWPQFKPVFLLTGQTPRVWEGEKGRLDETMLKRYVKDFSHGEFLMCGPVGFMENVKTLLEAQGVDVKSCLRKELFG